MEPSRVLRSPTCPISCRTPRLLHTQNLSLLVSYGHHPRSNYGESISLMLGQSLHVPFLAGISLLVYTLAKLKKETLKLTSIPRCDRRVNSGPSTRDTVGKAYDFALNHVGQDKDSGEIWAEYLQFIKAGEVRYSESSFNILESNYHLGRLRRRGKSNRRWMRFVECSNELYKYLWRMWKCYGRITKRLRGASIK